MYNMKSKSKGSLWAKHVAHQNKSSYYVNTMQVVLLVGQEVDSKVLWNVPSEKWKNTQHV